MRLEYAALAAFAALVVLSGCAANHERAVGSTAAVSTTASLTTTAPTLAPTTTELAPTPETTIFEPVESYVEPAPVYEEPYIVDCQLGLGPITTTWSDGSESGWSAYCQSVHDQVVQGEIDANTPTCETDVCVYPNGATIPNPNYRVVQTPSPWVQGQIDWQNCLEAGSTEEFCRVTLN